MVLNSVKDKLVLLGEKLAAPKAMRRFHGWATIFWLVMIPVSIHFGWIFSIAYVSALTVYDTVLGHFSSWQSARAEEAALEADNTEVIEEIHKSVKEDNGQEG